MDFAIRQDDQPLLIESARANDPQAEWIDGPLDLKHSRLDQLLAKLEMFCDERASRPNLGSVAAPLKDLDCLKEFGVLTAAIPAHLGGLGLGTELGTHLALLRLLSLIGGADLVLGRLIEGHINAIILIASYGTELQLKQAASDAAGGNLFGVWNTGGADPLVLTTADDDAYCLRGVKTFASGAAFVLRPIVTAEWQGHGWQMTLPRMESTAVAEQTNINKDSWHPLGMEGSESFEIGFMGAMVMADDLIGEPGDFYRDPLFRGGAIRFAAVHAGAVTRMHRLFAHWLESRGRGNDPYQVARLGEIAMKSQAAILWLERAAAIAEECLRPDASKLATERMIECANMTRVAIAQIATSVMQSVIAGVGAHGLLQPSTFEKTIRDLTMYLRQPAPDQALADVGRASLRKSALRIGGAENYMWRSYLRDGSLPSNYFQQLYGRSSDPWDFETSEYEAGKYRETLKSLPRSRYANALEVGGSIGVFTRLLANRCDRLLSIDLSKRALEIARERCAGLTNVTFAQVQLPREAPAERFDLIVVSEVAYYWSEESLEQCATILAARQVTGGHLVLVHLTTPVDDYPLTGDEVHETWLSRPEWQHIKHERHERYRIDVLERSDVK